MALQTNELYSESTRGALPRIHPEEGPGAVVTRAFAAGTALLPIGMPMTVNSSGFLTPIVPAGTAHASATAIEQLHCIIWPAPVQLVAGGEVLGVVMLKGSIHVDDLATAFGGSTANLLTALRNPVTRNRGLYIEGLTIAQ